MLFQFYFSFILHVRPAERYTLAATSTSVSTRMGDRQGRPSDVNLCPFVGVDLNL